MNWKDLCARTRASTFGGHNEKGTVARVNKALRLHYPKCQATEKNVKEAVSERGLDAQVDKVTDVMEIARYGVLGTPAVVIDGEVKSVGKIPNKDEIKTWIK